MFVCFTFSVVVSLASSIVIVPMWPVPVLPLPHRDVDASWHTVTDTVIDT